MKEEKFGLRLRWMGCACYELDFGGATVVNDPWITPNERNGLTWEEVEKCDYISLTHGHYDHTLDIPALVQKFGSYVLCGEQTAIPLMRWADLNPMTVYPMYPDVELDFDSFKVRALYGRHTPLPGTVNERRLKHATSPVNQGNPDLIELGEWGDFEYRNYLFTLPNGTKVLIWGNKLARPDQQNILRQVKPDIAILQMTGGNPPEDTAKICREMGCKVVLPHHMDFPKDYSPIVGKLGEELARQAPEIRYIIPEYGKWIEL